MQATIREQLAKELRKVLTSAENRRMRKAQQRSRPQLLFLENLNFINDVIRELVERGRIRKDFAQIQFTKEDLKKAQEIAQQYQDKYEIAAKEFVNGATNLENTRGGRTLQERFPHYYTKASQKYGGIYVLSSFDAIGKCKKEILQLFIDEASTEFRKILTRIDRGHGGGEDGVAVSGTQIAKGFGKIDKAFGQDDKARQQFTKDLETYLQDALDTGEITPEIATNIKDIRIKYEQIVTASGELSAKYIPFIDFQNKYDNSGTQKAQEVAAKKLMEKFFTELGAGKLASMHGSSSLKEKMIATAIAPLIKAEIKNKQVVVESYIDPRKVKLKTGGDVRDSSAKSYKKGKVSVTKASRKAIPSKRTSRASAKPTYSTAALLGIFNSQLPSRVARNMVYPHLEYRTGRFANSVRALDVTRTRDGYPSIGYTYQRNPYQTFETGFAQGDRDRDPRVIIDKSLRELATELALGRIYTRRL